MNKEVAKKLLSIIQAYIEGKTIQLQSGDKFIDVENPTFNANPFLYRSKPEYRPYKNAEELDEAIKQHGSWIKINKTNIRIQIIGYSDTLVWILNGNERNIYFKELLDNYTWLDGTPCGINE